jgi:diguanylate cyclase (GGDEF)-like protein
VPDGGPAPDPIEPAPIAFESPEHVDIQKSTTSPIMVQAESGRRSTSAAARRTYLLAAALATASVAGMAGLDLGVLPALSWTIPFWGISAITIACAFLVFDVDFRRETYTFTFNEIVLVIGAFFATPVGFVLGRLIGEALFLTIRERQPLRKLALNLSVIAAECVALLVVVQAFRPGLDVRQPICWLIAVLAVIAAEMVGYVSIASVIRWHGGPITLRSILQIGLITAPANTSLALVIVVIAGEQPAVLPLLLFVAGCMVLMYRSHSALKQRYESLNLLYEFTHLVSGVREPVQVLDAMLNQAKDTLRTERAEFWLLDDDVYRRHVVDDGGHSSMRVTLPPELAHVVEALGDDREAMLIARTTSDPVHRRVLAALAAEDALLAPVREGDTLLGFVAVVNRIGDIATFGGQDARMFATLASHAGVALQNGRLISRLHDQARQREHEAHHDPLTALPNRVLFGDELERRLAPSSAAGPSSFEREVGIALMDLDGFKEINDTLGHQSGDAVLIEVARRLRQSVAPGTIVARLGGDEFALLAPAGMRRDALESMCRRIRAEVAAPMEVEHLSINMGSSIGIAVAPFDGKDAETVLRRADVAMYSAKGGRGAGVCSYDPERDVNSPRRLALTNDIRNAVARGELFAVYQPKISLNDQRVVGVECLCRWNHPIFGAVQPDEFIPLADRTGSITGLTAWMLETALDQCERWARAGRDWGVAVNVSMRNLLDHELVVILERLLASSSVAPERVTLEITETHVMSDALRTADVLASLAALGVRLSIDDFGTGYSSLAYLQQLDVDEVKIDKSFIAELGFETGAEAIVRSVIDLARNLRLRVVAEGVENPTAAARLRMLGCHEAQGYYFARPMLAHDLEQAPIVLADKRPPPETLSQLLLTAL